MTTDEPLTAIARVRERAEGTPDDLAFLVECLGAPTKAVQRRAAEALGALSTAGIAVHDAIAPVLVAPALRTRFGAAYALSLLGPSPPECVPVLLETLGADDGDLRWAAATLLLPFGTGVLLQPLRELVRTGNVAQRKMALYCLRDVQPPPVGLDEELRAALGDEASVVRLAGMAALARLGRDRAVVSRALVPLLEDADLGVRRATAATLGRIGAADASVRDALARAATSTDAALAKAASNALTRL